MGLLAQTVRAAIAYPRGDRRTYWGWGSNFTGGSSRFRLPDEKDYANLVGDGSGASLITAVVNWYARNVIAARPILLYREPGSVVGRRIEPEDTEYAAVDLLRYPARDESSPPQGWITGTQMLQACAFDWVISGDVMRWKIRSDAGRVVARSWLPSWCTEPVGGNGRFIDYYRYRVDGVEYRLDPNDVDHLRFGLDRRNPRRGMSPIRGVLREVYTDEEAARFTAAVFANLAFPGAVVIPGKDVVLKDKTARDELRDTFDARFKNDGRGRTIVLSANAEVKFLQWSPQELNLGDMRDIPEERVSSQTGIPAAVLGFGTGLQQVKVGATMRELRAQAIEDALFPFLDAIAQNDTDCLLPDFIPAYKLARYEFGWDLSRMPGLSYLMKEKRDGVATLTREKIIKVDEARVDLGYPPVGEDKGGGFSKGSSATTPGGAMPNDGGDALAADEAAAEEEDVDEVATDDGLTLREREVALLTGRGYANKQIAAQVGITERTVERHLSRAKTKLGVTSRAELGAWAAKGGMPKTPDPLPMIVSAMEKVATSTLEVAKALGTQKHETVVRIEKGAVDVDVTTPPTSIAEGAVKVSVEAPKPSVLDVETTLKRDKTGRATGSTAVYRPRVEG